MDVAQDAEDTTLPIITITNQPCFITNQNIASTYFKVSKNETVTYSYLLDVEEQTTPFFADISEGEHTFTVTAKDEAGNTSTET